MATANNIRDERGFHNKAARHQLLCPVFAAPGLTTPWCSGPRAGYHGNESTEPVTSYRTMLCEIDGCHHAFEL